jgi:glycerol-3-phosphate dehydrogenase (NAD+)
MIKFSRMFFPKSVDERTFTEASAGVADLIASCGAGRNLHCAKHAVERGVTVEEIEAKEINGQKLQANSITRSVWRFCKVNG